ncbi:MAG: hypothetical protein M1383_04650 [Patescibacteria group bacterium]|nr:hypothetical protein [Patescibacteria group bacterium]
MKISGSGHRLRITGIKDGRDKAKDAPDKAIAKLVIDVKDVGTGLDLSLQGQARSKQRK